MSSNNINEKCSKMANEITPQNPEGEIILYTSEDGSVQMDVRIDGKTVWLTQQQIAQLYGKAKSTISEHITHIFEEGELDPQVVVREFRTTTQHGAIEGKTQTNITRFYNLSMIIAVGYRVRSKQGTMFRQWATKPWIPTPHALAC